MPAPILAAAGSGAEPSRSSSAAEAKAVTRAAGGSIGKVAAKCAARVLMSNEVGGCAPAAVCIWVGAKDSPSICCSISSILAFTPSSIFELISLLLPRRSNSSIRDEAEPSAANCSGVSPSRRIRRSMSNSRLRTKSLRRLRWTIARSSAFWSSPSGSSWRELISAQSVAGLATKRATFRKKLSPSFGSVMRVVPSGDSGSGLQGRCPLNPRTSFV